MTARRHAAQRDPTAHWLLLFLGVVVLLALLCLDGYAKGLAAEGRGAASGGPAAATVRGAAPVLDLAVPGAPHSVGMPPGTVALTFDDGPDPRWTPKILDVLARHHAHATFFVIGAKVNQYPELTRRIVAEGHELGVHTFTHANLSNVAGWRREVELGLTQNAIIAATGRRAVLARPPYSSEPDAVTEADVAAMRDVAAQGYLTVLTDHDTKDWAHPGVASIVQAATPAPGAGAVVMMHDGGGDRSQTVAALEQVLATGQARGTSFATVSQALKLPPAAAPTLAERARGAALRWAQTGADRLGALMRILLLLALVLALLRLAVQLVGAGVHVRRERRRDDALRYLGPVSVIVPAYNESANIADTVRSLVGSDYPKLEVIVVDDGSTDGTADLVESLGLPGVRVVRQANAGKPTALNTGVRHARGDLLVLVDGDTVFEPDAVGHVVQPFADPRVGAVSGNTKVANRRGLLGRWQHLEYVIGFNLDRRMFDVLECMPTVPGAIGAFRREVLEQVGGVSSATLAEDTDLTMAVLQAGWRVVYAEHAVAWTEAPSSLRQLWRQRYRWCYGTMQAMWKHRASVTARGGAGRLGRRGLPYLLLFQVLLPLSAPAVDAYAVYGMIFLPWLKVAGVWLGFVGLQMATAAYALRLDGEPMRPIWALPLQQIVYRQMMYLVVVQSTVMALVGSRLRWHRMVRTGEAAALANLR